MQQQILDAVRRGDHDVALGLARDMVAAAPGDAAAQRLLALALRAGGDVDAARAAIDRAIALAPQDAALHVHRAGLLLGDSDVQGARAALEESVKLDPNRFEAYLLQAQLAIALDDLAEAARAAQLAERVAPDHPMLHGVQGMLALRGGDADRALALLTSASRQLPDDANLRRALGFAFLAKGHLAFAEQAFRRVLEQEPGAQTLRVALSRVLLEQGRHDEAADAIAPLLDSPEATPALRRHAGELELSAGRVERALPLLRDALAAAPGDPRTLAALAEAWQRTGSHDEARASLDAALATGSAIDALWRARLRFADDAEDALALLARWRAAMPDSMLALETAMAVHAARGDADAADDAARAIVAIEPGHGSGELQLVESAIGRDPAAAIAHIERLMATAAPGDQQRLLRSLLARAHDRAGDPARAVALWSQIQQELAPLRAAPTEPAPAPAAWPARAVVAGVPEVAFLVGAPGSLVQRVASLLADNVAMFRADRFGMAPPADGLQVAETGAALASGALDPAALAGQWRAGLAARRTDGAVIDWIPFWDNGLALMLRAHLPDARVVFALRDPRDMLLDWLGFDSPVPLRFTSAEDAAGWLARWLGQVADLHDADLVPHVLLRIDQHSEDPAAMARLVGDGLGLSLPAPVPGRFGPARLPHGHWRQYIAELGPAFAMLEPVARRLGYDAN